MKLLIVEDDSLMSQALAGGLATQGIEDIEVAHSASMAMQLFRTFKPTVCLIDIELKIGPTGIDVAHAMRRLNSKVGIVFLTSLADPRLVSSAMPELPEGSIYLMKSAVENLKEVGDSIKLVALNDHKLTKSRGSQPSLDLSQAQFELIRLIAQGNSNMEIAKIRFITIKSTENAIARLAKKLGITSSTTTSQRVLLARKYAELIGKL